jgi:hypothetical protein
MMDRVCKAMSNLLGDSLLIAAASVSGDGSIGEIHSLIFHDEN